MTYKYITPVEEKLDQVRDEIYQKTKNLSWKEYQKFLKKQTDLFINEIGAKLTPTKIPGVYKVA